MAWLVARTACGCVKAEVISRPEEVGSGGASGLQGDRGNVARAGLRAMDEV